MLENQETPELTIDEKLANANLTDLANTPVKPLLDVLGQETTFYGYVDNRWISGGSDEVTVRMELTHLSKKVAEKEAEKQDYYAKLRALQNKVSKLEGYLDDNWDDIDEEVRDEICDIFGIENTVTKTVTISITGTIDISAPRGYDWDNIAEDINYDLDITLENSDLDKEGYGWSGNDFEVDVD